ncbi:hypothetical protein BGZ63DRAFT_424933 [Mariannaea sp. PMI_226]|nr:hypothetical protein BGZ63DRAFT_424933 [Mariannaea sp. PMI_226]
MSIYQGPAAGASPIAYRRACIACAVSKRRCSKQLPACKRCDAKGLGCLYPPVRQQIDLLPSSGAENILSHGPTDYDAFLHFDFAELQEIPSTSSDSQGSSVDVAHDLARRMPTSTPFWFAAHDSWEVSHTPPDQLVECIEEKNLKAYIATIQAWLKQWITDGHCPLFHRHLYQIHMPRCIQDAYTALIAYLNRAPSTESTVFHIIEDRVNQLLKEYATKSPLDSASLTVIDHAARVQALLVFQMIRLFDGDIRMRARAEKQLPTLVSWNEQMWQRLRDEMGIPDPNSIMPVGIGPYWGSWQMWLFVESVRRTWLITSTIYGVYMTMKEGYASCPGGVYCTFGSELWDIPTAHEWEERASGGKALFIQSLNIGDLLLDSSPGNIDEFGHATLLISHGLDRIDKWVREKG